MSVVSLGPQRSEAVGLGSNLCRVRYFYNFTDIYDSTEQNRDYPPTPTHKIFSMPNIFWKTGRFPYQVFCFGPLRQNFSDKTVMPPPPLLCLKNFDTAIFLKHRRVPLRSFSVMSDKKLSRENRDIPFSCEKFFDTGKFLMHRIVTQQNFSVL